ncbi:helix-turn-helix domain-containing protein [Candidatus Margulisiibacteriota bacterium]
MTKILTIKDVASILKVKPETISWWTRSRKIPFVKIGRYIRYLEKDILFWIESKKANINENISVYD